MRRLTEFGLVFIVLLAALLIQGRTGDNSTNAGNVRPFDEFYIVPVRVHLIRSDDVLAAGTRMTKEEIDRIYRKVNGIWHAAGIHMWVESIIEEKPAKLGGYEKESALPYSALQTLRPEASRANGMFHVYYVRAMVVNGLYIDQNAIFVQEVASLFPVPGGIDEPLPRVTAHELGHALKLPHRQDRTNLMASGTTGTSLNDEEVHTVRRAAESLKWVETPETFARKADTLLESGHKEAALSRFSALLDIPGNSALKERANERLGIRAP
jgi:hypothetical protein